MTLFAASFRVELLIWLVLCASALLGTLAIISPALFRRMSESGSQWFDTNKIVAILDTPIDVDKSMLHYSRTFGVAVVASSLFLGYLVFHRIHGGTFGW